MNAGSAPPGYSPVYAHVAFGATGPVSDGTPVPSTLSRSLGLLWPTSPVPGVPSTRYSPFHSHAPSRSMDSCTLQKGFEPSSHTNNKTTSFW